MDQAPTDLSAGRVSVSTDAVVCSSRVDAKENIPSKIREDRAIMIRALIPESPTQHCVMKNTMRVRGLGHGGVYSEHHSLTTLRVDR